MVLVPVAHSMLEKEGLEKMIDKNDINHEV